jgi:hypothetical protein
MSQQARSTIVTDHSRTECSLTSASPVCQRSPRRTDEPIYPRGVAPEVIDRCGELLDHFGTERGPSALMFPAGDHAFVEVAVNPRKRHAGTRWQMRIGKPVTLFAHLVLEVGCGCRRLARQGSVPMQEPPSPFRNAGEAERIRR